MKHLRKAEASGARFAAWALGVVLALVAVGVAATHFWQVRAKSGPASFQYQPRPKGQLTFNKDIAPLLFKHCTVCHRPGEAAPFAFLNYTDVRKHLDDIVTVTQSRYMPPWLPEPGHGAFNGTRRLSVEQLGMLEQWAREGAPEGNPQEAPAPPTFAGDWQLGPPDLVVTMPVSYPLRAEGPDVYRNFVIPVSLTKGRYVKAIEFHPGNPRVLHHAFIKVDRTEQSRRLEGEDNQPGFGGLQVPAEIPDGLLLGWQPGRIAAAFPDGMAFRLDPGNDFVVQAHLNPSGKPEKLQSSIGLYFTDQAPTKVCARMELTSYTIDIPAGATNYLVEDSLILAADCRLIAILPHAHYLAKEMEGWATRPDGSRESLILIKRWDFNWQTDYRYTEPVHLPKGTRLSMRFTYDNSAANPHNPNQPPKKVLYGARSSDEMAELWFQLLPENPADLAVLNRERESNARRRVLAQNRYLLQKNPNDPKALTEMGLILTSERKFAEAERMLRSAIQGRPDYALAHYNYGLLLRMTQRLRDARQEFEKVLALEPANAKAHGNLGFILADTGDRFGAEEHFAEALRLNPSDELAKSALAQLQQAR